MDLSIQPTVVIDGRETLGPGQLRVRRYLVKLSGIDYPLPPGPFRLVSLLGLARCNPWHRRWGGWVAKEQLYRWPDQARSWSWRTRRQIRDLTVLGLQCARNEAEDIEASEDTRQQAMVRVERLLRLWRWEVIENDRQGRYRLATEPELIAFPNPVALAQFGDVAIHEWMNKLL